MQFKKILILSFLSLAFAQFANAQTKQTEWPAMKAFHEVMSPSFHPVEEFNNFLPLKENAAQLKLRAQEWKDAEVPAGFNEKMTKQVLKKLAKKCTQLDDAVKANKPDPALKTLITQAHDLLHQIMEKCKE